MRIKFLYPFFPSFEIAEHLTRISLQTRAEKGNEMKSWKRELTNTFACFQCFSEIKRKINWPTNIVVPWRRREWKNRSIPCKDFIERKSAVICIEFRSLFCAWRGTNRKSSFSIISNISSTTCKWNILKHHFKWISNAYANWNVYALFHFFSIFIHYERLQRSENRAKFVCVLMIKKINKIRRLSLMFGADHR